MSPFGPNADCGYVGFHELGLELCSDDDIMGNLNLMYCLAPSDPSVYGLSMFRFTIASTWYLCPWSLSGAGWCFVEATLLICLEACLMAATC